MRWRGAAAALCRICISCGSVDVFYAHVLNLTIVTELTVERIVSFIWAYNLLRNDTQLMVPYNEKQKCERRSQMLIPTVCLCSCFTWLDPGPRSGGLQSQIHAGAFLIQADTALETSDCFINCSPSAIATITVTRGGWGLVRLQVYRLMSRSVCAVWDPNQVVESEAGIRLLLRLQSCVRYP